jgi:3,4-dihydroxy 2-butanone 4-phosphate synthase/GTP cyclohydrolase II
MKQLHIVKKPCRRRPSFTRIENAIAAIRAGQMVIVVDDEDRENEGDLTIAAEKITPQAINFVAQYGRGLICLAMTAERLDALQIPLMVSQNSSRFETAFCVSIEVKERTTTGISAADRAATVLTAIDPSTKPSDLVRPGHVFPLRARSAGGLARAGHTEAAVDLARLAGLHPSGVICEIMNRDGTMARVPQLSRFAKRHSMPLVTVTDLITYRMRTESVVQCSFHEAPNRVWRIPASRIRESDRQANARRPRARRSRRWTGRTRARSLTVPYQRCLVFSSV